MISIFPAFGIVARHEGLLGGPANALWVRQTWDYLGTHYGAKPATQSDTNLYGAFIVFRDSEDEVAFRLKYNV